MPPRKPAPPAPKIDKANHYHVMHVTLDADGQFYLPPGYTIEDAYIPESPTAGITVICKVG
jgi:hypothetical protein